jgi:hypothetical protein
MTLFFMLAQQSDKESALRSAVTARPRGLVYNLNASELSQIPRSPFAYWTSDQIRTVFARIPQLEGAHLTAKQGLATANDFRFLRCAWEVPGSLASNWVPFAKGGASGAFYQDLDLTILWLPDGHEVKAWAGSLYNESHWSRTIRNSHYYPRSGLSWPLRTQSGLRFRAIPSSSLFGHKGPVIFGSSDEMATLAVVNSLIFRHLVSLQMTFGSYEVGVIQRTPLPQTESGSFPQLRSLARSAWSRYRSLDTTVEVSHAFVLPAMLQVDGGVFGERCSAWSARVSAVEADLVGVQADIDEFCFELYGISQEDRRAIAEGFGLAERGGEDGGDDVDPEDIDGDDHAGLVELDSAGLAAGLVSWAVGVGVGRFDVRLATGERAWPLEPDPFDPLPVCSPGMLAGHDGLPLAGLPTCYPVSVSAVLVSDPGHRLDIAGRARSVFEVVFGDDADDWWSDVGAALGARGGEVGGWLVKGFFDHHLKTYSRSRRKAPLLWPIGTKSGSYLVWLYAHRVSADSLFQVLVDVVVPKLDVEDRELTRLRQDAGVNPSASQRKSIEAQDRLVSELRELRQELEAVAPLWAPDLNDGVVIALAPLWRLFAHHRAWSNELKQHWGKLLRGDYDWAQLAMHIWPERVVPKCAVDRSLAIAHGLEDVFWVQEPGNADRWHARAEPTVQIDQLVAQRQNPAVTAALQRVTM